MKKKKLHKFILLLLFISFFTELWIVKIVTTSQMERLSEETVKKMEFRDQEIGESMSSYIKDKQDPSLEIGLYLLESKFGYQKFQYAYQEESFLKLKNKWKTQKGWNAYTQFINAIWSDLKYFPIPESTSDASMKVSFTNSWMSERTYGGKRGHEGTDIMANKNVPGVYPIISMTNGIVRSKGWLEKGGYRIGVEAPSGAYFYYAHLDSYASVEIGDTIRAGDILGFMGDSGYGEEGTTGMFPVHLHVGVYIYPEEEMSINPYWLLRYLENRRVKCSYSSGDIE